MNPKRIQMSRSRPWRHLHPDAVIVDRRTKWGNPKRLKTRAESAQWYRRVVAGQRQSEWYPCDGWMPTIEAIRAELAGRDLACWCPLDSACHADVLLEIANSPCPATGHPHGDHCCRVHGTHTVPHVGCVLR